jgi:hypothetical protein
MVGSSVWLCAAAVAADVPAARLYGIETELSMPNLEDNLRYSITHGTECLTDEQLEVRFPVLTQPSVSDCQLYDRQSDGARISYHLACTAGHGTTGGVQWDWGEHQRTGVLHVKLGGKNMTFFQRVTAISLGRCKS